MGCLNSEGKFKHWFGNIHLSGPCNRRCYFCIGQHMMALDGYNNLDTSPLLGLDGFLDQCISRGVKEINVTGTNTDPLLYRHHEALRNQIRSRIPGVTLGIRTNGADAEKWVSVMLGCYEKASISITSLNPDLYRKTMGVGEPPDVAALIAAAPNRDIKVNVVLCPETRADLFDTIHSLREAGIRRINLREPYGQPRVGNPFDGMAFPDGFVLGMPLYRVGKCTVTYWDVHYCEVESVNLYASGRVSVDYPITRGHDDSGTVQDQSSWPGGRVREQWITPTVSANPRSQFP